MALRHVIAGILEGGNGVLLQTILNRVHKQRLFVYGKARLIEGPIPELEVDLRPRANSRARWARRLSWKETATVFQVSWDRVFRSVEMAVEWGRERRDLEGVCSIGVDEIAWQRGHRY